MRSEPQIIGIKQNGTAIFGSPKNYEIMQKNSMVIQLIDGLVSDYYSFSATLTVSKPEYVKYHIVHHIDSIILKL